MHTMPEACLAEVNRKLPKNTLVAWWGQARLIKIEQTLPDACVPYDILATSMVIEHTSSGKAVMSFKDLVKKTNATGVHGYEPFPEMKVPSSLFCIPAMFGACLLNSLME